MESTTENRAFRNPVNRVCGEIIRRSRQNNRMSHAQMAEALGITASYLKSAEIALFSIHVSQSISLYNVWQSGTDRKSKQYTLQGIIALLSVISIMESHAQDHIRRQATKKFNPKKDRNPREVTSQEIRKKKVGKETIETSDINNWYAEGLLLTVKSLSDNTTRRNDRINKLLAKFIDTDLFNPEQSSKSIANMQEMIDHVENFLINYETFGLRLNEEQERQIAGFLESFLDVPSFYIDFITRTSEQLKFLPVRFNIADLAEWEIKNAHRFQEMFVYVRGNYNPFHQRELSKYSYAFIKNPTFRQLGIIYEGKHTISVMEIKKQLNDLSEEYDEIFNNKVAVISNHRAVNQYFFSPKTKYDRIDDTDKYYEYDAIWFIRLDTYWVGFLAREKKHTDDAYYFLDGARSISVKEITENFSFIQELLEVTKNKINKSIK